jgi:hypothetical protein
MTPQARSMQLLRQESYVVDVAERFIAAVRRRKDLLGFADLVAVHPHLAGPLLVQVTTACHLADRSRKVRASVAARLWLRAGGRIELHGWERKDGRWRCRRQEVKGEDMLAADLTPRPKRRRKQRGLFDKLEAPT